MSIKLLLVEDDPADVRVIRELLREAAGDKFDVTDVGRLDAALLEVDRETYDVAVLDLTLPDTQGLAAVERLQQASPDLPVVVLTDSRDEDLALHIVKSGIQDYLIKGRSDGHSLNRALLYAIERKRMQRDLVQLAQYDHLTGLPNRSLLRDRLNQAMVRTERSKKNLALMFLDLDRFKTINDSLGHAVGDQLLVAATERLSSCLRREDTVARFAGDEFVVVLEGITEDWHASIVAEKILHTLSLPMFLEGHEVYTPVSIGIALFPRDGADMDMLLRNADAAMYEAKARGGNVARFYEPRMNERSYERLTLQNALRRALDRDELLLHYQPIYALRSGEIVGLEALMRWQHPTRGLLLPAEFIGCMEETGLIVAAGEWALRTACADYQAWRTAGLPPLHIKVNMSAQQFGSGEFLTFVQEVLQQTDIEPWCLSLELTEDTFMGKTRQSGQTLKQLHDIGVLLSIDDFGTGYSSLTYFRRFLVDTIKIDQSFVAGIPHDPDGVAIVNAIIGMAHNLRLKVTAEGVETVEQLAFLKAANCDEAQGFLLGRPLPADEVLAFVASRQTVVNLRASI